jgi:hypothetical protein
VLDAVAGEDARAAVVHADGHLDVQLAVWHAEEEAHLFLETEIVGGALEEVDDLFEARRDLSERCGYLRVLHDLWRMFGGSGRSGQCSGRDKGAVAA